MRASKVATKFANQLLEEYENGTHVLDCFRMYIGYLTLFGGHQGGKDLRLITPWQMEDMEGAIYNDKVDYTRETLEVIWNKNRRSAKTENATMLATFFAAINKEVKWRSCYMPQMKEARVWYNLNPLVSKVSAHDGLVYLRGKSYYPIDLAVLTTGNVSGVECDVLILDEGGWAFKHMKLYEAYHTVRPLVSASDFKHILHVSTPAKSTAFAEAWDYLLRKEDKKETKFTVLRTADDCPWITPEFIEEERLANIECPWFVQMNYYGEFAVKGGAVFGNYYDVNDSLHVTEELYEQFRRATPRHGGVDWNGNITKHYLVLCYIDADYIFVKKEITFLDINILKKYEKTVSLELEDDDPYSDELVQTAK